MPDDRPVVVLIGAPGAGKTRLGKRIARLLGVQLSVSADAVAKRIAGDKRPLVNGVDAWSALVATRRPVYDRLADRTFDTSSLPLDRIAADVVSWIQETTND